jgi:hypothetical protein
MKYVVYRASTIYRICDTLKQATRAINTLDRAYGASVHFYRQELIQA